MISKISIIIPNYNNAKYLPSCLKSVLLQTLKDIEVIVIDDCSTDNSAEFIEHFASRDSRIKFIKMPQNSGVGAARNAGLNEASGEFVMFLDSDDCLYLNAAESLLGVAYANGAIITVGKYSYVDAHFSWNISVANGAVGGHGFSTFGNKVNFIKAIDFGITPLTCWGKLFHRETLNNLRFSTDIYPCEDFDFMFRAYSHLSNRVAVLSDVPCVFYRRSANSVIGDGITPKFIEGWRLAVLSISKYISNDSEYRRFFGKHVLAMFKSLQPSKAKGERAASLKRAIRDIRSAGVFAGAGLTLRERVGVWLG
jgi:glycosyltransferase involved in cell wall biosynthesis